MTQKPPKSHASHSIPTHHPNFSGNICALKSTQDMKGVVLYFILHYVQLGGKCLQEKLSKLFFQKHFNFTPCFGCQYFNRLPEVLKTAKIKVILPSFAQFQKVTLTKPFKLHFSISFGFLSQNWYFIFQRIYQHMAIFGKRKNGQTG